MMVLRLLAVPMLIPQVTVSFVKWVSHDLVVTLLETKPLTPPSLAYGRLKEVATNETEQPRLLIGRTPGGGRYHWSYWPWYNQHADQFGQTGSKERRDDQLDLGERFNGENFSE
jgi:hypothetical protein